MTSRRATALSIACALLACAPLSPPAGPTARAEVDAAPAPTEDPAARWYAFSRPGPRHEALARFLGDWSTRTSVWLEPGGEPYWVSEGTASHTWLEEGRWVGLESSGTLNEIPHHGFGMLGHDNFKQQYVASFVDNVSTSLLVMSGSWNETTDELRLFGRVDEPLTGVHDRAVEYVFRFHGADSLTLSVNDLPRGEPSKVLEIGYARRVAPGEEATASPPAR